ncbi:HxlR family transcriptional regulator [Frondihabitans sucicola]|uniref:HxlR family transcriptional regulator n=1 Tax=Frondihabitans sucicola TaxID=1268041 RepID=A0ABM8GP51_9MICO|nr:helix-turn-helix domain-containing protein [Frondihabitans sucicola]BDZ50222.1 HxlR family transcriptional regulator [Frondihabitans sucicola]
MTSRSCPDPTCGIARSLDVLGERWALLVIRDAMLGRTRFSEFRSHLGVSPDILTARLASLVEFGVLTRQTYREPGEREREEYLLTDAGRELSAVLAALNAWGVEHRPVDAGSRITYTDPDSGAALRLAFVDPDGREVAPGAVHLSRREPA